MIKGILILGIAVVLWSCKKNDDNSTPKRLKSVSLYEKRGTFYRLRKTDSILYDSRNRMVECRRFSFDTANQNISFHQSNYIFSYSGSDTLPSSYIITYSYSSNTNHHALTYNNFNQPVKDSHFQQMHSIYFSYAPNVIVTNSTSISGASGTRIDSFILQNGNIVFHYYIFPHDNTSNSVDQITYSTFTNPLYNFKGIGVLLYAMFQPEFDWISRNLFATITNNRNLGNMSMTWRADANGNVISGSGGTAGSSLQMTFNYD